MDLLNSISWTLLAGLLFSYGSALSAAESVKPPPLQRSVEVGRSHETYSTDHPAQRSFYVRGVLQSGARDIWNAEILEEERFHDQGVYFSVRNTHTFSPDWYGSLAIGSSTDGFFLPRLRADAFLNRKWGRDRDLVTWVGLGYYKARDVHTDHSLSAGAIYYLPSGTVLEVGVRWNESSPGGVTARSQFIAITHGRSGHQTLTLRLAAGREAYQLIGPATSLVDFASHEATLTWRQWMGADWGLKLMGSYYKNPSYDRKGVSGGVFTCF